MALDARNNSALFKRAEQLKRWEESDTNQATVVPKNAHARKVKFSAGCVFLAACMAGDKDEVLRLLEQENADINTCNVDGLTALHQACIDDNLDMVEFLVEHGADVNRADNEGWTPLHATASCGFVSIARYLIESGADLSTVSSDGELPIDLSTSNSMEDLLQKHIDEQEIDCEEARSREERMMMSDAKRWLRSDASEVDRPHPRTGATALHVAAAKGYNHVLSLLLAGRANVDKQDNDGWTPLHAAAHWGQKEAAHMLITALADIDTKNFAGQTAIDVADGSLARYLEEIRKKKNKRRPGSQIRIQDGLDANNETPPKVIRVEVKPELKDEERPKAPSEQITNRPEIIEEDSNTWRRPPITTAKARARQESPPKSQVPDKEVTPSDSEVILRRTQSFEHDEKFYQKYRELRARIKANSCPVLPATPAKGVVGGGPKTVGRVDSTGSVEVRGNTGVVVNTNPSQTYSVQRSASLKDYRQIRKTPVSPPQSPTTQTPTTAASAPVRRNVEENVASGVEQTNNNAQSQAQSNQQTTNKMSPGNIFKNFFKSFVPPTRDEESETQRKAHAKRVRETRRSTQGVTLDEIKSAEELVKKKNLNNNNANANNENPSAVASNERVPGNVVAVEAKASATPGSPPDAQDKVSKVSPPLAVDVGTKKEPDEVVTATYTLTAPQATTGKRDSSDDKVVVASYTISPPPAAATANDVTFRASIPSARDDGARTGGGGGDGDGRKGVTTISATINVPSSNKKTDLEELTRTASPTVKSSFRFDKLASDRKGHEEVEGSTKEPQVVEMQPPERMPRYKRSLFDMDNASSLSLAEKLRNEANKYSEASRATVITTSGHTDVVEAGSKCDPPQASPLHQATPDRRPSWRLKVDTGSKFKLEEVTSSSDAAVTTTAGSSPTSTVIPTVSVQRRPNSVISGSTATTTTTVTLNPRPVSVPLLPSSAAALEAQQNDRSPSKGSSANDADSLVRRFKNSDDKENDKENDSRSVQATQAVIQRRRRPKRRSTGVVHVDMDEIDPERQESPVDGDDKESGNEQPSSRSRLQSASSVDQTAESKSDAGDVEENGELIDYKALYEASRVEIENLKMQLQKKEETLHSTKAALERFTNATTKNSLSELEKRERRAMERRMSEMEEELKQQEVLKAENQRLKDENGALIRVISKLSK
ncbi:protein phosphatase 1 regulatory subunit 12B isoform X4 [Lutzomyia longipalpis]|uniref:protein phosphatase 1 regulatory subunit 12B isoform X4 n=1 Tax=Lutzomyia longipalpis TaxID=7200 RepID=UPI002483AF86|nr:protein phosphatase 1 regulatory subunit 12B isoform X4 [Lutzomyia longipalpis]